jgi:hypothetical protein
MPLSFCGGRKSKRAVSSWQAEQGTAQPPTGCRQHCALHTGLARQPTPQPASQPASQPAARAPTHLWHVICEQLQRLVPVRQAVDPPQRPQPQGLQVRPFLHRPPAPHEGAVPFLGGGGGLTGQRLQRRGRGGAWEG